MLRILYDKSLTVCIIGDAKLVVAHYSEWDGKNREEETVNLRKFSRKMSEVNRISFSNLTISITFHTIFRLLVNMTSIL